LNEFGRTVTTRIDLNHVERTGAASASAAALCPFAATSMRIDLDQARLDGICRCWDFAAQSPDRTLPTTPRPRIRHCPLCGIAMQAKKSRDDQVDFDIFECLSCGTVIREAQSHQRGGNDSNGGRTRR
jgi:Zn ribbon nucleic-acid-binding protein